METTDNGNTGKEMNTKIESWQEKIQTETKLQAKTDENQEIMAINLK
jgi:hypothetical protein